MNAILSSKTVWVNIIAALIAGVQALMGTAVVPNIVIITVLALLNAVLTVLKSVQIKDGKELQELYLEKNKELIKMYNEQMDVDNDDYQRKLARENLKQRGII